MWVCQHGHTEQKLPGWEVQASEQQAAVTGSLLCGSIALLWHCVCTAGTGAVGAAARHQRHPQEHLTRPHQGQPAGKAPIPRFDKCTCTVCRVLSFIGKFRHLTVRVLPWTALACAVVWRQTE